MTEIVKTLPTKADFGEKLLEAARYVLALERSARRRREHKVGIFP